MMRPQVRSAARTKQFGFTLIEILVALAVLAISLSALVKTVGETMSNASYLRDKSLAHWVAMNEVVRLRLAATWPALGVYRGTANMADRSWQWRAEVQVSADDDVHKVQLRVFRGGEDAVIDEVTAYLTQPRDPVR